MEETLNKIQNYLTRKNNVCVETVMKEFDLKDYEVYGLIELLKQKGYMFEIIDGKIVKIKPIKENEVYHIPNNLEHLKLLLISDTHLASRYDRVDILRYLYQEAEDRGVNYVLHSGDLTEGVSNRPQQQYELKENSYTGQRDYVIDKYPRSDIPTYMIAGNHDLWWIQRCGADIVQDICNHRPDLTYLGSDCEDLKIGKLPIRLYHGAKGQAYAKSYKLQKYVDLIPPEERPYIIQTGHTHNAFYMKQGNTHCFQTSCLQDLTPFGRTMGLSNDKSCWWVDVDMDNKGKPVRMKQELETFSKKLIRK